MRTSDADSLVYHIRLALILVLGSLIFFGDPIPNDPRRFWLNPRLREGVSA